MFTARPGRPHPLPWSICKAADDNPFKRPNSSAAEQKTCRVLTLNPKTSFEQITLAPITFVETKMERILSLFSLFPLQKKESIFQISSSPPVWLLRRQFRNCTCVLSPVRYAQQHACAPNRRVTPKVKVRVSQTPAPMNVVKCNSLPVRCTHVCMYTAIDSHFSGQNRRSSSTYSSMIARSLPFLHASVY